MLGPFISSTKNDLQIAIAALIAFVLMLVPACFAQQGSKPRNMDVNTAKIVERLNGSASCLTISFRAARRNGKVSGFSSLTLYTGNWTFESSAFDSSGPINDAVQISEAEAKRIIALLATRGILKDCSKFCSPKQTEKKLPLPQGFKPFNPGEQPNGSVQIITTEDQNWHLYYDASLKPGAAADIFIACSPIVSGKAKEYLLLLAKNSDNL